MWNADEEPFPFSNYPTGNKITFQTGYPQPDTIPIQAMKESSEQFFAQIASRTDFFQYSHPAGYPAIRKSLARFLDRLYKCEEKTDWEQILITAGCSGGLDLLMTILQLGKGDIVYVDELSYFCGLVMIEERGCETRYIPFKGDQLDLEAFEEELKDPDVAARTKMVYTIPTFQNPTGAVWSLTTRKGLISLAHKYDFHIASDEVYNTLVFPQSANGLPPSMALLDDVITGRVASIGSLAKVLCPAIRIGWIHASKNLIERLENSAFLASGSCPTHFNFGLIHPMMDSGKIDEIVAEITDQLTRKSKVLFDAVKENIPSACVISPFSSESEPTAPGGGYFMCITLPSGISANELAAYCKKELDLVVMPTSLCGDKRDDRIRLCFAYHKELELKEGAVRLGKAIRHFMKMSSVS